MDSAYERIDQEIGDPQTGRCAMMEDLFCNEVSLIVLGVK